MHEKTRRTSDNASHDPLLPPGGDEVPTDPGAYIGHEPELARETIPGGVQPGDVRVSAGPSQPMGKGEQEQAAGLTGGAPEGHRMGARADDDDVREAGQNR